MLNRSSMKNKRHLITDLGEPPDKKVLSDGEIFIKQLAEKQASTKTSLQEQLMLNQQFQKGSEFISLTKHTAGSSSLDEFNANTQRTDDWERLKSYGLTDADIELYLNSLNDKIDKKRKILNQDVREQRLQRIRAILENCERQSTTDNKIAPSRQLMENVLATKPNSIETRLLKFALENQTNHNESLPHPMDNIKEVEAKLIEDLSPVNIKKIRKKCRSLARQIEADPSTKREPDRIPPNPCPLVNVSKWDIKTTIPENNEHQPLKIYSCQPKKLYTINNGTIIQLPNSNEKLTIDEIRRLSKFENYHPGTPSKTLFVKNLANSVTEADLKRFLGDFLHHIESVRVMGGRMRGQAFIEFYSVELAQQCLDQTNGRILKNKPMIIQFGRKNQ